MLLSIEHYWKLAGGQRTLADALAQPDAADIDFHPPRGDDLHRLPDLD